MNGEFTLMREVWDAFVAIRVVGFLSGVLVVLATWLALQEHYGHPRNAFAFDFYRGSGTPPTVLGSLLQYAVTNAPYRMGDTYLATSAWTMLAVGFVFGMVTFLTFRVQEHFGRHVWQRHAEEGDHVLARPL